MGEVYCWGGNEGWQLGDNSDTSREVPVKVLGGAQGGSYLENIIQISSVAYHSCALTIDGEVYCWGRNWYGQLGDGSTVSSKIPVRVLGGAQGGMYLGNVNQISVHDSHTCAVTTTKEVYCWGENYDGELGNNSTIGSETPVRVLGGEQGGTYLENISEVYTGYKYNCGLTVDGTIYCWGNNRSGQLGNNSLRKSLVPVKVKGGAQGGVFLENIYQIAVGYSHSCALDANGTLYCWGGDTDGQFGNNTSTGNQSMPAKVIGGEQGGTYLENITQISTGYSHSCGVTIFGDAYCWGSNGGGRLGNNSSTSSKVAVQVMGGAQGGEFLENVSQISVGDFYSCALIIGGEVYCWGANGLGSLGNNSTTGSQIPVKVVSGEQGGTFLNNISQISIKKNHACGVTTGGEVYCWGYNSSGQLGNNSTTNGKVPVKVKGGAQGGTYLNGISQVSAGDSLTCALTTDGEVYCWGYNYYGQLGNNSKTQSLVPVKVSGGEQGGTYLTGISEISVGEYHACIVTIGGEVYCWGYNSSGQLGNDSTTNSMIPVKVLGGEQGNTYLENINRIYTGYSHSCGVTTSNEVYCWGDNSSGQLGNNTTVNSKVPVKVKGGAQGDIYLKNISKASASKSNTCVVTTGGEEYCWGKNDAGQLGLGEFSTPQKIYDGSGVAPCTLSCCAQWQYPTIGNVCSRGIGMCLVSGKMSCKGKGVSGVVMCNAIAGNSGDEVCNGYDDDCDGDVDEELNCPTNTPTATPTSTLTNTFISTFTMTPTNTFTSTFTMTPTNTFTPTFTMTSTNTTTYTVSNTVTNTQTIVVEERIVSPEVKLKKPIQEDSLKGDIKIKFEKFTGASLKDSKTKDMKAKYQYLIHIRKLKRLGYKDKYYRLGRKKLFFKKSNCYVFKNADKGVYSIRYRVVITKNKIKRRTKWSGRNLIVF